jgi:hypothetical protein
MLRGTANAALALCLQQRADPELEAGLRDIVQCLSRVKLSALAPPDMQAIEHARTHESHVPDVGDVEMSAQSTMDGLEDALEALSTSKSAGKEDVMKRSAEASADLARLSERLQTTCHQLGI